MRPGRIWGLRQLDPLRTWLHGPRARLAEKQILQRLHMHCYAHHANCDGHAMQRRILGCAAVWPLMARTQQSKMRVIEARLHYAGRGRGAAGAL
jgi:hypothetical protein